MKVLFSKVTLTVIALLGASSAFAQTPGGIATVATIGEPPTFDAMVSGTDVVGMITQHIFETLYTFDEDWTVVPLLAQDMPDVSDDGLIYTIKLREGVVFHDSSSLTSSDVVSSLERWTEVASRGQQAATVIESIAAVDDFTVEIVLTSPYAPLLSLLAFNNSAAIIIPQEAAGVPMESYIGSGPYELAEHVPDRFIRLVRFEDYASRDEEPSRYAGARHAYLDEIHFMPVPDGNTRVEASMAGQYSYVDSLAVESYDRLNEGANEPLLLQDFGWPIFVMNTQEGVLADPLLRRAVQTALSGTDMLTVAFGNPEFFSVDAPLYPEGFVWRTDVGADQYDLADTEAASALLEEANYDGAPLRILTSQQYPFHYKMAQVAEAYLEAAGFTVDMQVVEWATLVQQNKKPELWEVFITHSPFLPEPALNFIFNASAGGWWSTPEKEEALLAFNSALNQSDRVEAFATLQELYFEQAPVIKVGNFAALSSISHDLQGFEPSPWPAFWNAYLEDE